MSNNPMDAHVGGRLNLRRTMLGMSQETLGNAVGVTFQQVQKYERGTNRIGAGRLHDFAGILNVPVSYFYEDFEGDTAVGFAEESSQYQHAVMDSREALALVSSFSKISDPVVRKRLLSFIKALGADAETERENEAA